MAFHPPSAAQVRTACPYCGVGCGIVVSRGLDGALNLTGDPEHPSNFGRLCSKGRSLLHAVANHSTRLLRPEVRLDRADPRQATTWEAAIGHVAGRFAAIVAEHGPDAVAFYVSGQCLTEEYHLANKIAKGFIGTNNIDTNSRLCMSSAVAAYKLALGSDSVPCSYEDLDCADTFLICGSNAAWTHPIIFQRIEDRRRADPDVRIVVVDPRRTATAASADLHLAIRPGSDVALYLGMARCLLDAGAVDLAFISDHCVGWEALRERLGAWSPERAAEAAGIAVADLRTAAGWIAGRRFLSLWTMGLNQAADAVDRNLALINLNLITGSIGRPGCGPFSLTGQPNAMGGREVGGLANLLPAHRNLADPAHRAAVEDAWGVPRGRIRATPGLTATEIIDAAESGRLKALWIIATNPVASLPDADRVRAALGRLDLLVVQDAFANDTTPLADVLLPAATWLEKTGTMTTSERRVHLVQRLVDAPGEALPDVDILLRFARASGWTRAFAHADAAAVYAEHASLTVGTDCDVGGISHDRLRGEGSVQWPAPAADHPGTARLFTDHRFRHADGRARLHAPEPMVRAAGIGSDRTRPDATSPEYPLVLITSRLRDHWHTATRTGLVRRLDSEDRPFIEVHPDDAAAAGLVDGAVAEVASRRGSLRTRVRVTVDVRPGSVAMPMHFGPLRGGDDGQVNAVTSSAVDPRSKEPDLKFAAVSIRPYRPAARRIVVLGAGASALALVRAMRSAGLADQVTVVGDEPDGFYDRVQLPHYVAGERGWSELTTADQDEVARLHVGLRCGVGAVAIERDVRLVRLADGSQLPYDHLVMATGSRPADQLPARRPSGGVHGLRRRRDAEAIIAAASPGRGAVIVGAGLLGLELADALRRRGMAVTVVQRSDRCMGRVLDAVAAGHLASLLRGRGIDLRLNAIITAIEGDAQPSAVVLADGVRIPADLVVMATGTVPNDDLARACGLAAGRGIAVDDRLATADPRISAIGEVASWRGRSAGTTAECQAQAAVLVAHLAGDPHARYRGPLAANILKIDGLALASVGVVDEQPGDEVVRFEDPALHQYQKAVVRAGRLVGAILLGDTSAFPRLHDLVLNGTELDDLRQTLLRPGGAATPVQGRLICSCRQVGETTVREAIAAGACDVAAVAAATGAGTGCGSCRGEVRRVLDSAGKPGGMARRAAASTS
jgi:ferredoxin-nitrate reductase